MPTSNDNNCAYFHANGSLSKNLRAYLFSCSIFHIFLILRTFCTFFAFLFYVYEL